MPLAGVVRSLPHPLRWALRRIDAIRQADLALGGLFNWLLALLVSLPSGFHGHDACMGWRPLLSPRPPAHLPAWSLTRPTHTSCLPTRLPACSNQVLVRGATQLDRAAIALDARPQLRAAVALYFLLLHVFALLF